jgi:hypothetical protein
MGGIIRGLYFLLLITWEFCLFMHTKPVAQAGSGLSEQRISASICYMVLVNYTLTLYVFTL